MRHPAQDRIDFVPHLPSLLLSMADCWRAIGDAQTEVDPFGANYAALGQAREAIRVAVDRLTGQSGFLSLTGPEASRERLRSVGIDRDGRVIP